MPPQNPPIATTTSTADSSSTPAPRRFTSSLRSSGDFNSSVSASATAAAAATSSARFLHPSQRQSSSVKRDENHSPRQGQNQTRSEAYSWTQKTRGKGRGGEMTPGTKRRKISVPSSRAVTGSYNDDHNSSPGELSSSSSARRDQISDISDDEPIVDDNPVSPFKAISTATSTRSAAVPTIPPSTYPTIQSRLFNPSSASTSTSTSTPTPTSFRRPPTTPSKRQNTTPPNVLPDVFSPSRRRGQKEYLPSGAAEHVRSWILDILARSSQPDHPTSAATSHVAGGGGGGGSSTIVSPNVLCRDPGGRFALISESHSSRLSETGKQTKATGNGSVQAEAARNPRTEMHEENESEGGRGKEAHRYHLLINTDLYQANSRQATTLARQKIEKLTSSQTSHTRANTSIQSNTNQALNWSMQMDVSIFDPAANNHSDTHKDSDEKVDSENSNHDVITVDRLDPSVVTSTDMGTKDQANASTSTSSPVKSDPKSNLNSKSAQSTTLHSEIETEIQIENQHTNDGARGRTQTSTQIHDDDHNHGYAEEHADADVTQYHLLPESPRAPTDIAIPRRNQIEVAVHVNWVVT